LTPTLEGADLLKTSDFSFELPGHLIAQTPSEKREESRLMLVDRRLGTLSHYTIRDFPDLPEPGSLVVFNDTRVRKARLYGESETGGKVELLLLNPEDQERCVWTAMVSKAKKQLPGKRLAFPDGVEAVIEPSEKDPGGSLNAFRRIRFNMPLEEAYLEANGHIPLPPYIKRPDTVTDHERYQTVYARNPGSVAAPTAGLHFTREILKELENRGIEQARVTLHVGLGTFLPVRSEMLTDHEMHRERYDISEETAQIINRAISERRKIVAVGTTSVRTLESAWNNEKERLDSGPGETALFIYPGYTFKVVDQLFTNFHTPESTLLMLVCAFAGKEPIDRAYQTAIEESYRFFSYGDAMYIR
jgi:S-adenosylmethionine:tRNA ribosyltransferase-isomerase